MQILLIIGGTILTILTTCIGERLFSLVNQKIRNEKVRNILNNIKSIILDNVKTTQQIYVKDYKKEKNFHEEIQKEVLELTKNSIIKQLSGEVKNYIEDTYGNLDDYIVNQIEATIYDLRH